MYNTITDVPLIDIKMLDEDIKQLNQWPTTTW